MDPPPPFAPQPSWLYAGAMARKSIYTGVTKKRAGWQAQAWPTYLGIFPTELLAARAVAKHRKVPLKELRKQPGTRPSTTRRPTRTHMYVYPHKGSWVIHKNRRTVGWAPSHAKAVALASKILKRPASSFALRCATSIARPKVECLI